MKLMKRNTRTIWYCLYSNHEPILDEDGYETGEYTVGYKKPVEVTCSVSPASGMAQTLIFGTNVSYDKVVLVDSVNCPIDENTVLFVDKKPEFKDGQPVYDYVVHKVAKSLNGISYAIRSVKVMHDGE